MPCSLRNLITGRLVWLFSAKARKSFTCTAMQQLYQNMNACSLHCNTGHLNKVILQTTWICCVIKATQYCKQLQTNQVWAESMNSRYRKRLTTGKARQRVPKQAAGSQPATAETATSAYTDANISCSTCTIIRHS